MILVAFFSRSKFAFEIEVARLKISIKFFLHSTQNEKILCFHEMDFFRGVILQGVIFQNQYFSSKVKTSGMVLVSFERQLATLLA